MAAAGIVGTGSPPRADVEDDHGPEHLDGAEPQPRRAHGGHFRDRRRSPAPHTEVIPLPGSAPAQPPREDGTRAQDVNVDLGLSQSCPHPTLTVLAVRGEVDALTAPRLAAALDELLDGAGEREIAVDLEGVTFLASSGLGVLIDTARRAARDDRRLFVVAANRAVLRPLEVTGSAQLFTVVPDRSGIPGP